MSVMVGATERVRRSGGAGSGRPQLRLLPTPVEQENATLPAGEPGGSAGRWSEGVGESRRASLDAEPRPALRMLPPLPPEAPVVADPFDLRPVESRSLDVLAPAPEWQLTNRGMALALAGLTALLSSAVATVVWGFLQVSSAPLP